MDLYFAKLSLDVRDKEGFPGLYSRAYGVSDWLKKSGFEFTRSSSEIIGEYQYLEQSLARYDEKPCNDVIVDLNVLRRDGMRFSLDLASNSEEMISRIFSQITIIKPRLKVDLDPFCFKTDANAEFFRNITFGNRKVMAYSVDQLREFLGIR